MAMTDSAWLQKLPQPLALLPQILLLLLVLRQAQDAVATVDTIVYWNSSNPIFKPAGENSITVQLQDRVTFVCPTDGQEFYQIYWTTSLVQSQSCSGGSLLFSCRRMDSYLVIVQIFPADPTAPGFNSPVYFYTPSTGSLAGMDQTQGGACLSRNMRLTVRTVESSTASPNQMEAPHGAATSPEPDVALPVTRLHQRQRQQQQPLRRPPEAESAGVTDPQQTVVVRQEQQQQQQQTTGANNGRLASRSGSMDEEPRLDPYQLNLITGCSMPTPHRAAVAGLATLVTVLAAYLH